jgi:DhnA family fructose-bisphosphate aldolase class Ia
MTDYNIADFQMDCFAFNEIANKHNKTTLKDIDFQYKLILEETKEIKEKGINKNNAKEVLDGTIDVMVTALGLLQKLEYLGVDVNKAMRDTAANNLTKYPSKELTAIKTAQMYEEDGVAVDVHYNSEYELFIIKNWNDKVMKPIGFESNDLSNCIPKELLENGFVTE